MISIESPTQFFDFGLKNVFIAVLRFSAYPIGAKMRFFSDFSYFLRLIGYQITNDHII